MADMVWCLVLCAFPLMGHDVRFVMMTDVVGCLVSCDWVCVLLLLGEQCVRCEDCFPVATHGNEATGPSLSIARV